MKVNKAYDSAGIAAYQHAGYNQLSTLRVRSAIGAW